MKSFLQYTKHFWQKQLLHQNIILTVCSFFGVKIIFKFYLVYELQAMFILSLLNLKNCFVCSCIIIYD